MSLPSDVTVDNFKDFYTMILPYLNVGNGGTSDTPLGQVAFFDDVVAPAGWLIADGTVYNISDYPDLANQYERVHGSKNFYGGNGTTTFAVPNWQGEFLRASGTNGHANQGSGAAVGVHQDATEHLNFYSYNLVSIGIHTLGGDNHAKKTDYANNEAATNIYTDQIKSAGAYTGTTYTSRPTNTSLLLCIKAVPSSEMNTYSLTERRVGTWIDGKPLYQISFHETGISNQSKITIPANITIREVTGATGATGLNYWYSTTNYLSYWLHYAQNAISFDMAGRSNITVDLTIRYTKNTD